MNISYLLIGGNEGDRTANLQRACDHISDSGCRILQASSVYETAAWGKTDEKPFLNQALQVGTGLDAWPLMQVLLEIEQKMGRVRLERYGARLIDIDILFFNDAIMNQPQLIIPHPEVPNRRFALVPMEEIAADYIHPVLHRSIAELLAICPDPLEVRKLKKSKLN